jgi:peptide deformylase
MNLILAPDPILTKIAEDWNFTVDTDTETVEAEMIRIMNTFNGIGLAGNQVGLLKRVFVIKLKNHADRTDPFAMFNPRVISESTTTQTTDEGCLSFPELWLGVSRPNKIESEYIDKYGTPCTITLTGIAARCFLHELDHLNGIVFTEKVSQMKLILAKKQQRKYNGRTK